MYEDLLVKRLIELRTQKGVSAREMSLAIGQNSSYINRIENSKALPSVQVLFYICEYLNVTPAEFFDIQTVNPTKTNELLQLAKGLTTEQLHLLIEIAKGFRK